MPSVSSHRPAVGSIDTGVHTRHQFPVEDEMFTASDLRDCYGQLQRFNLRAALDCFLR